VPVAVVFAGALWHRRCPQNQAQSYTKLTALGALLAGLYLIPWTPRKPFVGALESVRSGMTLVEVRRTMAGSLEGTSTRWERTGDAGHATVVQGPVYFRHSDDPSFNADIGAVYFANGRVTHVEFSPD
jgi:hypothetical protein